jgi:hypothetical protein
MQLNCVGKKPDILKTVCILIIRELSLMVHETLVLFIQLTQPVAKEVYNEYGILCALSRM